MLPNTNNALTLFGCIFDFPVNPITVLCLGGDVTNEHPSPIDGRRKDLRLDVVLISGIVELSCVDGGISDFHPFQRQQVLELLESMIVLVDMANKYIFLICQTSPPSFHMLLKLNRISRRCGECYWLAYAAIEFIPAMTHLLGVYALVYITVNIRWYRMESPAATLTLAQFN